LIEMRSNERNKQRNVTAVEIVHLQRISKRGGEGYEGVFQRADRDRLQARRGA
jgi:hypothetical protein